MATPSISPRKRLRQQQLRSALPPARSIGRSSAPTDDLYHFILTRSWYQFFLLIALCFFLINALFALLYHAQPGAILNAPSGSLEDAFYFSVQTMATIGYGAMAPATRSAHLLVTLEALVGMLFTALCTGLAFAKFARPTARVLFADHPIITPRNGVPHLQFRMANWRHNSILEAQLRVLLVVLERTQEGEVMRRPQELKLVRDRTALFFMSWTAMHIIDESSPFYGPDALARLKEQQAEIYLSLLGMDETLGQTVHARYSYQLEDILHGVRYADILTVLPDGTRQLNYHHFHEVVPLP